MSRRRFILSADRHSIAKVTGKNGMVHEYAGPLRDGYEGKVATREGQITEHRERIATALELERMRESIHRCDDGIIH